MSFEFVSTPSQMTSASHIYISEEELKRFEEPYKPKENPGFKAVKKSICKDAQEMLSIRQHLGMSQPDFAIALGETRDKIVNIENGRLIKVAPALLARARALLTAEQEGRVTILDEIRLLTMDQLIDRWKDMVGEEDDRLAAVLLGTTSSTFIRWRNTGVRPISSDILRYEHIAKKIQEKRLATKKSKKTAAA